MCREMCSCRVSHNTWSTLEHFVGVQSATSHPGLGSYEAHPAGRMLGDGLPGQERPDPWGVRVRRGGAIK